MGRDRTPQHDRPQCHSGPEPTGTHQRRKLSVLVVIGTDLAAETHQWTFESPVLLYSFIPTMMNN